MKRNKYYSSMKVEQEVINQDESLASQLADALRELDHEVARNGRHGPGLHSAQLPGQPDLVLLNEARVVFVPNCQDYGCRLCPKPVKLSDIRRHIQTNKRQDVARAREQLKRIGWQSSIVMECQIKEDVRTVARRII